MNQIDFIKETMNIDHVVNPDLAITLEIYKYLVENTLSMTVSSPAEKLPWCSFR